MNKTLSVNIGGIVFHIEELAFDRLNKYLEAIKGYFTTSDGRDEIIQDIEGRIGEMFQERISNSKQVITDSDVEQVINVMGRPEQFAGDEGESSFQEPIARSERRAYRKLYRDPDDRVIGGVCSGFGHYLNIDPLWIRLAFAIAFFFFGSGLLLYIILILVMPKAVTTSEKLEMKGERVNISNISRTLGAESQVRSESGFTRFFDALGELIVGFFRLLGKLLAVIFVIIGLIMFVGLIMLLLGLMGVGGISVPVVITDLFMEPWQQTLGVIAAFFVIGIPLMLVVFKAVRMLFKVKYESRMLNWVALSLWITGIIFSIIVIASVGTEFSERERQRVEIPIVQPATDTLYLDMMHSMNDRDENYYINNHRINDPWTVASGDDTIRIESVNLDIIRSATENFELVQINTSSGKDRKLALENARNMSYKIDQQDSLLRFDETFTLPRGTKYRNQRLQLILKVPVGKSVFLSDDMNHIIYDIKNVTNTYDGNMIGKTWTMTQKGLECIGCNLEDEHFNRQEDVRIRINGKGVKVEGVDENSDSTFSIDGDDVKINIDGDGIQIDARKK